ncbi:MAG: ABC transporter ATP-binding protein, partial [Actinomycetes bacterium]
QLRGESESMTFEARTGLDLDSLGSALPPGYQVSEQGPGRYVIEGEATPRALALITAWLADHDVETTGIRTGRTSLEQLIIGDDS